MNKQSTNRVPNMELYGLVVDGDHEGAELDSDGEVMHRLQQPTNHDAH